MCLLWDFLNILKNVEAGLFSGQADQPTVSFPPGLETPSPCPGDPNRLQREFFTQPGPPLAKVAARLCSHYPPNQASGHSGQTDRLTSHFSPGSCREAQSNQARPLGVRGWSPSLQPWDPGLSCRHSPDTLFPLPRAALGLHSHLRRPYSPFKLEHRSQLSGQLLTRNFPPF